ncbi:hypothetical protein DNTS_034684 [Danionella cerebrum]|uniref:Uncharacterized protein n=1 Tax=Danionella cerebrum TaxID=2873325 RepID=A0A553NKV4_9TELE|nr:hypothetical protein DNTS_034684 [Danionella translucida]
MNAVSTDYVTGYSNGRCVMTSHRHTKIVNAGEQIDSGRLTAVKVEFIKEEIEEVKIEETFAIKDEEVNTEEASSVKDELKIEETFRIKDEEMNAEETFQVKDEERSPRFMKIRSSTFRHIAITPSMKCVGCQTGPPPVLVTTGTQLSLPKLTPSFKSAGVQTDMECEMVDIKIEPIKKKTKKRQC